MKASGQQQTNILTIATMQVSVLYHGIEIYPAAPQGKLSNPLLLHHNLHKCHDYINRLYAIKTSSRHQHPFTHLLLNCISNSGSRRTRHQNPKQPRRHIRRKMAANTITLDVSGRKFRTTKSVLSVSPYFEALFARWEDCIHLQEDGSYYVDADPDAFECLLNFMRRPSKFPLYWTRQDGFNYVLYSKVEAEADFFMLEGLRDWIKKQKYLEAVQVFQRRETNNDYGHAWDNRNTNDAVYTADAIVQNFVVEDKLVTLRTGVYFEPEVLVNHV
jgi:hypothetical protein